MEKQKNHCLHLPKQRAVCGLSRSREECDQPIIQPTYISHDSVAYKRIIQHYQATQQIDLALRRIACPENVPAYLSKYPLLEIVRETACDLHLTLMELTVWACFLEQYIWNSGGCNIKAKIMYSAWAVKRDLNESLPYFFQAFLEAKYSEFLVNYQVWIEDMLRVATDQPIPEIQLCSFPPTVINEMFRRLTTPVSEKEVNYNFEVDEILIVKEVDEQATRYPLTLQEEELKCSDNLSVEWWSSSSSSVDNDESGITTWMIVDDN